MAAVQCAKCGTGWNATYLSQCPRCGSSETVASGDTFVQDPSVLAISAAQPVTIVDIRMSWGSVFDIAWKFAVVFALFQAAFLIVAIIVWG